MNKNGTNLVVNMTGIIDEDTDFTQFKLEGFSNIELELAGVKSINSCGIREWIKWLAPTKNCSIIFSRCPKVIVDQMNMVDGFLPSHAQVKSFYVPYYNENSGIEKSVLFAQGKEYVGSDLKPPAEIKDEAGNVMEMDVIESKYFKFLKK